MELFKLADLTNWLVTVLFLF